MELRMKPTQEQHHCTLCGEHKPLVAELWATAGDTLVGSDEPYRAASLCADCVAAGPAGAAHRTRVAAAAHRDVAATLDFLAGEVEKADWSAAGQLAP